MLSCLLAGVALATEPEVAPTGGDAGTTEFVPSVPAGRSYHQAVQIAVGTPEPDVERDREPPGSGTFESRAFALELAPHPDPVAGRRRPVWVPEGAPPASFRQDRALQVAVPSRLALLSGSGLRAVGGWVDESVRIHPDQARR